MRQGRRSLLLAFVPGFALANVLLAWTPVDVFEPNELTGQITYDGPPPTPRKLNVRPLKGDNVKLPIFDRTWVVGPRGGVANVVVWIRPTDGKPFHIPKERRKRENDAHIDIRQCQFEPRVQVMFTSYFDPKRRLQIDTGQKLLIKCHDAGIAHFPAIEGWPRGINVAQNSVVMPARSQFRAPMLAAHGGELGTGQIVSIQSNVRTWMQAYALVFDHPFAAVTSGDLANAKEFGKFVIRDIPLGRDVEIVYWHESSGWRVLKKLRLKRGKNRADIKIRQAAKE